MQPTLCPGVTLQLQCSEGNKSHIILIMPQDLGEKCLWKINKSFCNGYVTIFSPFSPFLLHPPFQPATYGYGPVFFYKLSLAGTIRDPCWKGSFSSCYGSSAALNEKDPLNPGYSWLESEQDLLFTFFFCHYPLYKSNLLKVDLSRFLFIAMKETPGVSGKSVSRGRKKKSPIQSSIKLDANHLNG